MVSGIDILRAEKSDSEGLLGDIGCIVTEEIKEGQEKPKSILYVSKQNLDTAKNYLTGIILIKSTNLGNTLIPSTYEPLLEMKGAQSSQPGTMPVLNMTQSTDEALFWVFN